MKLPYPPGQPHDLLKLLSEVCDNHRDSSDGSDDDSEDSDYRNYVEVLEWRVKQTDMPTEIVQSTIQATKPNKVTVLELFQLATLIYLERTTAKLPGPSPKLVELVDRAFIMLHELETCQWPFPLLIFGYEARDDTERALILHVIEKTMQADHFQNFGSLRTMIRFVWTQDDLSEKAIHYVEKLSALMSISNRVPSFI